MRGRGTGGLLIVALGVGMAVGQDPILPPIPDGPTLTILQAGDQIPVIPPKSLPPLPPPPAALPKQMPPSSGAIAPAPDTAAPSVLTANPEAPTAVEGTPLFVAPWHPEPPPANYTTSGCNFNVWCGDELFSPDFTTVQMLAGGYFSSKSIGPKVPRFDYAPVTIRWGTMINAPQDTDALYRGNMEVLFDLTAGYVNGSFGNYLFGPAVIGRYNFVQPNAPIIPYLQVGAGFIVTDAYKYRTQDAIGQQVDARLFAGLGVHCQLRQDLFLDIEGGYSSISNFGATDRGAGVHSLGVQVGLTYFFRSRGH